MPITLLTPPTDPGDLPAGDLPALDRIASGNRVGPSAANRQPKSLEKRTNTLVAKVNEVATAVNDFTFSGLVRADGTVPMAADLDLGTHKMVGVVSGTAPSHGVNKSQMDAGDAAATAAAVAAAPIITAWVDAGAVGITASPTSPTKGNAPVRDKIFWRRVGDTMEVRFEYKGGGTGASGGSGMYRFTVPASKVADTAKIWTATTMLNDYVCVGSCSVSSDGGNTLSGAVILGTGGAWVHLYVGDATNEGHVSSGYVGMGSATSFSGIYQIPIVGWGVNTGAT